MSIVYKDIDTYTPKSSVAGTEKIPVSSSEYITPNQITAPFTRGNGRLFYGTCDTAAGTAAKVVTCPAFTSADLADGSIVLVKFENTNTTTTVNLTMNVNGTGAYPIRTLRNQALQEVSGVGNIRACTTLFVYSLGTSNSYWILVGVDTDSNTTYSAMTQSNIEDGADTTGLRISPKLLRDNFPLKSEVPTFVHLTDESDMPATPDANTIYMIDE